MLMALEFGDARLVSHLREVIAERFAGDPDMINFQRDKLGGQVFGAPFSKQLLITGFDQYWESVRLMACVMEYLGNFSPP